MPVGTTAPTATVNLGPVNPTVASTLTATATTADLNGFPVTLEYQWFNNGVLIQTDNVSALSDTLTAANAKNDVKGNVITVTVTPSDSAATGTAVSATQTIADSAPTATVALTPLNPAASQIITATATDADADGDPVTLNYVWSRNGNVVQTDNNAGLTDTYNLALPGNGASGDRITVAVTPNDGTLNGTPATAATNVAGTAVAISVALTPPSPTTTQTLTASTTVVNNPDGKAVSFTYVWSRNGTVIQTTSNTSSLTDTLNLATPGFGGRGNVITVAVTPTANGLIGATGSSSVTIVNSPPVISRESRSRLRSQP